MTILVGCSRIKEAELKADKVRVYFNNHARSKSVRNAFLLMDMLLIEHEPKEIQLSGPVYPGRVLVLVQGVHDNLIRFLISSHQGSLSWSAI
jgi:hypothetical protein